MAKLYNLANMTTATTGTGTITLGSAVSGWLTFALAGVQDAETVTYAIRDGANSEIGRGVYTSSGTTLTRSVLKSTNSDAAISLSGSAEVFITAAAEDIKSHDWTTEEVVTVSSAQATAATFPSSGSFDTSKEYRIEFNSWTCAADTSLCARVNVGAGIISTSSYERSCLTQVAGVDAANDKAAASGSSVMVVAINNDSNANSRGSFQFVPGLQATTKAQFEVDSTYLNTAGLATRYAGVCALSTPTNAAITQVQLFAVSQNTTAGTFILKSRPLTPTP